MTLRLSWWIGMGCLCAWVITASGRAQSAYGPGGLFMLPSGYTSPEGTVALGMMGGIEDMWAPHPHEHFWLSNAIAYGVTERVQAGVTNIVMQNLDMPPTWGVFAKYQLQAEKGALPALAVSGVWLPTGHWRTEAVSFSGSKEFRFNETVAAHLHLGAMHARWFNGFKKGEHPYQGELLEEWKEGDPVPLLDGRTDTRHHAVWQAPFAGVDVGLGTYVKLTAEGRFRMTADDPEAIPVRVGILFALPKGGRLGFAWGSDGLSKNAALTIGVGYNISTVD